MWFLSEKLGAPFEEQERLDTKTVDVRVIISAQMVVTKEYFTDEGALNLVRVELLQALDTEIEKLRFKE